MAWVRLYIKDNIKIYENSNKDCRMGIKSLLNSRITALLILVLF